MPTRHARDRAFFLCRQVRLHHVPVIWCRPRDRRGDRPLALWLPALGVDKEWVVPFLDEEQNVNPSAADISSSGAERHV